MVDPIPLFPGIPGGPELLVILLIAVLLFGANKIPKLARSTGQAMGEFQKGREEVEEELQEIREGGETGTDASTLGDEPEMATDSDSETETETESETETETETESETATETDDTTSA